ncbi:MAG: S46 family peptidase, partial [Candidatus Omnitrophota bacterium]
MKAILKIFAVILLPAIAAASDQTNRLYQPGGMWMPHQIAELHGETLKKMGLQLDPAVFADPLQFPLNAIVSLGGCSASFISADGLIITNYHCVRGALQYNSTENANLLKTGYLAHDRSQELFAGPTARVYVVTAIDDVTERMLNGAADLADGLERYKELEKREKQIVEAAEKSKPNTRCEVARFYGGGKFYLITKLEIKDVRLVYAPHNGVGEFGGEIDNWMWPRHDADFSLLRAYVGPDGKPAEYSKDNVPYKPKSFLKIADESFKPGDLAFVVGYPAVTERLTTAKEVVEEIEWRLPRTIRFYQQHIDVLNAVAKDDPDLKIKAAYTLAGLENYKKKYIGTLEGAQNEKLVQKKKDEEAALTLWIQSSLQNKQEYGNIIEKINGLIGESQKSRETNQTLKFLAYRRTAQLLNAAIDIVHMAEERPKPDLERDPDYQERNWKRLEQAQERLQKNYSRAIEQAIFELDLKDCFSLEEELRPQVVEDFLASADVSDETIHQKAEELFSGTKLGNLDERLNLLRSASIKDMQNSEDKLIQFALKLSPCLEKIKDKEKRLSGDMILARPIYYKALEAFHQGVLASDANGTIRISYGTV